MTQSLEKTIEQGNLCEIVTRQNALKKQAIFRPKGGMSETDTRQAISHKLITKQKHNPMSRNKGTGRSSHHWTNSPPHPPQQDRLHYRKTKKTNTRNTTPLKPHTALTTPAKTPLTKQAIYQIPTRDSDLTCRFPQFPIALKVQQCQPPPPPLS